MFLSFQSLCELWAKTFCGWYNNAIWITASFSRCWKKTRVLLTNIYLFKEANRSRYYLIISIFYLSEMVYYSESQLTKHLEFQRRRKSQRFHPISVIQEIQYVNFTVARFLLSLLLIGLLKYSWKKRTGREDSKSINYHSYFQEKNTLSFI